MSTPKKRSKVSVQQLCRKISDNVARLESLATMPEKEEEFAKLAKGLQKSTSTLREGAKKIPCESTSLKESGDRLVDHMARFLECARNLFQGNGSSGDEVHQCADRVLETISSIKVEAVAIAKQMSATLSKSSGKRMNVQQLSETTAKVDQAGKAMRGMQQSIANLETAEYNLSEKEAAMALSAVIRFAKASEETRACADSLFQETQQLVKMGRKAIKDPSLREVFDGTVARVEKELEAIKSAAKQTAARLEATSPPGDPRSSTAVSETQKPQPPRITPTTGGLSRGSTFSEAGPHRGKMVQSSAVGSESSSIQLVGGFKKTNAAAALLAQSGMDPSLAGTGSDGLSDWLDEGGQKSLIAQKKKERQQKRLSEKPSTKKKFSLFGRKRMKRKKLSNAEKAELARRKHAEQQAEQRRLQETTRAEREREELRQIAKEKEAREAAANAAKEEQERKKREELEWAAKERDNLQRAAKEKQQKEAAKKEELERRLEAARAKDTAAQKLQEQDQSTDARPSVAVLEPLPNHIMAVEKFDTSKPQPVPEPEPVNDTIGVELEGMLDGLFQTLEGLEAEEVANAFQSSETGQVPETPVEPQSIEQQTLVEPEAVHEELDAINFDNMFAEIEGLQEIEFTEPTKLELKAEPQMDLAAGQPGPAKQPTSATVPIPTMDMEATQASEIDEQIRLKEESIRQKEAARQQEEQEKLRQDIIAQEEKLKARQEKLDAMRVNRQKKEAELEAQTRAKEAKLAELRAKKAALQARRAQEEAEMQAHLQELNTRGEVDKTDQLQQESEEIVAERLEREMQESEDQLNARRETELAAQMKEEEKQNAMRAAEAAARLAAEEKARKIEEVKAARAKAEAEKELARQKEEEQKRLQRQAEIEEKARVEEAAKQALLEQKRLEREKEERLKAEAEAKEKADRERAAARSKEEEEARADRRRKERARIEEEMRKKEHALAEERKRAQEEEEKKRRAEIAKTEEEARKAAALAKQFEERSTAEDERIEKLEEQRRLLMEKNKTKAGERSAEAPILGSLRSGNAPGTVIVRLCEDCGEEAGADPFCDSCGGTIVEVELDESMVQDGDLDLVADDDVDAVKVCMECGEEGEDAYCALCGGDMISLDEDDFASSDAGEDIDNLINGLSRKDDDSDPDVSDEFDSDLAALEAEFDSDAEIDDLDLETDHVVMRTYDSKVAYFTIRRWIERSHRDI